MTEEERRLLWRHLRTPVLSFIALLLLLGVNVGLGALLPFRQAWVVECVVTVCMVAVVLLFSMEVLQEPPLVRVFSVLGFFWVAIMFAMTSVDYLSR